MGVFLPDQFLLLLRFLSCWQVGAASRLCRAIHRQRQIHIQGVLGIRISVVANILFAGINMTAVRCSYLNLVDAIFHAHQ